MWLRTKSASTPRASEITPEGVYLRRRELLASAAAVGAASLAPRAVRAADSLETSRLAAKKNATYSLDEAATELDDATRYNNFYEFGTEKGDPARYGHELVTRPWTVEIGGEVGKPGKIGIEDLLGRFPLEERVYRLRCVEAWSMVIPWIGFPLRDLLASVEPTSKAKFVDFRTLVRPEQLRGQRRGVLDWPYREGLRLDEAMHPLTLLAVGMYGHELPNQNGAPLRLVVPWKYGFKSIKSIVSIELTTERPETSWNLSAPREYGFYSNVNPEVDHPRWSQARERRIGDGILTPKRPTLPFNGYADEVASMYTGMDLAKHF